MDERVSRLYDLAEIIHRPQLSPAQFAAAFREIGVIVAGVGVEKMTGHYPLSAERWVDRVARGEGCA